MAKNWVHPILGRPRLIYRWPSVDIEKGREGCEWPVEVSYIYIYMSLHNPTKSWVGPHAPESTCSPIIAALRSSKCFFKWANDLVSLLWVYILHFSMYLEGPGISKLGGWSLLRMYKAWGGLKTHYLSAGPERQFFSVLCKTIQTVFAQ